VDLIIVFRADRLRESETDELVTARDRHRLGYLVSSRLPIVSIYFALHLGCNDFLVLLFAFCHVLIAPAYQYDRGVADQTAGHFGE
jgi:hypothetical protein